MSTSEELLSSICDKDVDIWLHSGLFHYSDPASVLTELEESSLKSAGRELISMLLARGAPPNVDQFLIPITFQQELALAFAGEFFFVPFAVRLTGKLDIHALIESLHELVKRHDALRTKIVVTDARLSLEVDRFSSCRFEIVCLTESSGSSPDEEIQVEAARIINRWLNAGETSFDAAVLKINEGEHVLLALFDHYFEDYATCVLVFRELWQFYRIFRNAEKPGPPIISMQYADYAIWQREAYSAWLELNGAYWKRRLSDARVIQPPLDGKLGDVAFDWVRSEYSDSLSRALYDVARRIGVSISIVMLCVVSISISQWSAQREFVIPFTFSGRYYPEHLGIAGFFVNFLPLRVKIDGNNTFTGQAIALSREFLSTLDRLDIGPNIHGIGLELLKGPFFQWIPSDRTAIDLMVPSETDWDAGKEGLAISPFHANWPRPVNLAPANHETLRLDFWPSAQGVIGDCVYRADLYSAEAIERLLSNSRLVAEQVADNADAALSSLCVWE